MSLHKSKAARKAALASPKNKVAAIAGALATVAVAASSASAAVASFQAAAEHKRPAPDGFGPMRANRFDEATAMASAAAGLKNYTVVAPDREEDAVAYALCGRRSVEYAPSHAVPTGGERRLFDLKTIGEETRNINAQAATDAALSHSANDKARARKERDPLQPRYEMGDFIDDEDGWNESEAYAKGKRR